jgi:hypothetical protein
VVIHLTINNLNVLNVMGRKKKGTGIYFTEETQEAIVKYPTLTNQWEKDALYRDYIHKPFLKIAEVWYNKLSTPYIDEEPLDAQIDCVIFMFEKLNMFKADKGKAFSYFSIIARNYFILKNNKNYVAKKKKMVDNFSDEFDIEDTSYEKAEVKEFYEKVYPLFVQWLKDNYDSLFRVSTQTVFADELIRFMEQDIDSIEQFSPSVLKAQMYENLKGKISRPQLTKALNAVGIYFLQFRETFMNDEKIVSVGIKKIPEEKKMWIRQNFKHRDKRFGVSGLAKQLKVTELEVRNFLNREKLL